MPHGRVPPATVYSRTANQMLNGTWLFDRGGSQDVVKNFLIRHYLAASKDLQSLCPSRSISCKCFGQFYFAEFRFHYGQSIEILGGHVNQIVWPRDITVPLELKQIKISSPHAGGSHFGFFDLYGPKGESRKVLWKEPNSIHGRDKWEAELKGAEYASKYYPFVQRAVKAKSGELLYPYFDGKLQSEERVRYIKSGRKNLLLQNFILGIELRKAEDILRASIKSFQKKIEEPSPRIHRLYHDRRINANQLFSTFFKDGIDFNGTIVPTSEFRRAPIVVNSVQYPSFDTLARKAEVLLHPDNMCTGYIYGHGDCHGGNVLVENSSTPLGNRKILYIDFEYAGFHSMFVDFPIPFFIDVFFDIACNHLIDEEINVTVIFQDGRVEITLIPIEDTLNSGILEIKTRYLLVPLFEFAKGQGIDLSKAIEQVASALFLFGSTKMYWPGGCKWNEMFARLAVGVAFSQIKDISDVGGVWRLLHSVWGQENY